MAQNFEYKFVDLDVVDSDIVAGGQARQLTEHGAEGWQLIHVVTIQVSARLKARHYFQRTRSV